MATSRTRNRSQPVALGQHTITYLGGMTGTPVNETVAQPKPPYSQTTSDCVVKRFRELSQKGEIFNNPFSSTQTWYSSSGSYVSEMWAKILNGAPDPTKGYDRHTWTDGLAFFGILPYDTEPFIDIEGLYAAAKIDALRNVNRSDVMAYVTVGEWHKTKVLHRQVGGAFLDLIKGAYSRNSGRSIAKASANAWMTYRYAVMPTIYELEGAVKLLERKLANRYTARGKNASGLLTSGPTTRYVADSGGWVHTFETVCTREVQIRAGLLYESTDIGKFVGGTGLTRPLSSVYELTKFSWMLDWWINIGDWLDAVQPNGASKTLCAWIGHRDRVVHTARYVSSAQTGGTANERLMNKTRSITGHNRTYIIDRKVRDPWSGSPPLFPANGSGLNSFRCADIISLVTQRLGIKRGGYVSGIRF